MSTPNNGGDAEGWGKDNEGFGDLPRYGSTNHPEDQPGYGQGQPYSSGYDSNYGNTGYSGAQFGGAGYAEPIYNEGEYQGNLVGTNGKLQVFNAIGFGFKRTFSNAKMWLLGSLAFVIFFLIIGGIVGVFFGPDYSQTSGSVQVGTDWASNIVGLISLLLMPFIYRLATKEVDSRATGWASIGKDVHYFPTIIITLILWAVGMVFSFLFIDQILGRFIAEVEAAGTDDTAVYNAMAENLGGFLGASLLILIGSVLLSPLYQLMVWYAADGRGGIGQAISQGLKTGVSNYLQLLGFNIVIGFAITFIVFVTLGLGMIVALPAYLLAQAHAYRQIAGGPVPDDSIYRS